MMRLRRPFFLSALLVVATAAACTLNPQPLPPEPGIEDGADAGSSFGSADATRDSAAANPTVPGDGGSGADGSQTGDGDGSTPNGDGGDAGPTDASDSG